MFGLLREKHLSRRTREEHVAGAVSSAAQRDASP